MRPAAVPVGSPPVREPDGLALSSRNVYLNAEERHAATVLYRALDAARSELAAGVRDALQLQAALHRTLSAERLARVDSPAPPPAPPPPPPPPPHPPSPPPPSALLPH